VDTQALLPRPARVRRAGGHWLEQRRRAGAQRPEVLANLLDDSSRARSPATSTGACRCRSTAGATAPDKRIYVSVRRRRRLPVGVHRVGPPHRGNDDAWPASGGRDAGVRQPTTSWARTTSSPTPRSGPPRLLG
jgi:hypothetical protein